MCICIHGIFKSVFISRLSVEESLASISIDVADKQNCQIVSMSLYYAKMMKEVWYEWLEVVQLQY